MMKLQSTLMTLALVTLLACGSENSATLSADGVAAETFPAVEGFWADEQKTQAMSVTLYGEVTLYATSHVGHYGKIEKTDDKHIYNLPLSDAVIAEKIKKDYDGLTVPDDVMKEIVKGYKETKVEIDVRGKKLLYVKTTNESQNVSETLRVFKVTQEEFEQIAKTYTEPTQ